MNIFFLIFCALSVLTFIIFPFSVYLFRKKHPNHEKRLTLYWSLCLMTAISSFFWFFPFFWTTETANNALLKSGKAFCASIQSVIRIFAVDDFRELYEIIAEFELGTFALQVYTVIGIAMYLVAPILTFGFILAIFKNVYAYFKYTTFFGKEVHIFSELNERSLALASSILKEKNKGQKKKIRKLVIFADILDKNEEEHLDLVAKAKELGALLFRQDLTEIRLKRSEQKKFFYLISDDEREKITQMEHVISVYKNVPETKLYVFSDDEESKCFLDSYPSAEKENMLLDVIRVNDIRSLIYHNLDENGLRLFERSKKCEDSNERIIHAAIVGFGKYGKELMKALLWYTQLPGYRLKLTVFDENKDRNIASEIFKGMCPEIKIGESYGDESDMRYEIHFESCKEGTAAFYDKLASLSDLTYVFVALGKDSLNISAAMGIRNALAKHRRYPDVETVVYDSKLKRQLGVKWEENAPDAFGHMEDLIQIIQKNCAELKRAGGFEEITELTDAAISKMRATAAELQKLIRRKEEFSKEGQDLFAEGKQCAKKFKDEYKKFLNDIMEKGNGKNKLYYLLTEIIRTADLMLGLFDRPYKDIHQIHIIGDLESFYSQETVIGSDLTADGASINHRYCRAIQTADKIRANKSFYMDDYNFFSSVAKALHARLRAKINAKLEKEKDNPHVKEIFFTFIPPEASNGGDSSLKHPYECNRFILKNTSDTLSAQYLESAMENYQNVIGIAQYKPFQLTEAEKKRLSQAADFHYDKETFTPEDLMEIAKSAARIEHVRWNAYMRSEGFVFANDFKKDWDRPLGIHGDLRVCEELNFADIIKDI